MQLRKLADWHEVTKEGTRTLPSLHMEESKLVKPKTRKMHLYSRDEIAKVAD